jgi:hypothetical protein
MQNSGASRRGIAGSYLKLLAVWNCRSIAFRTVCRTAALVDWLPAFCSSARAFEDFQLKISVILPLNDRQGTRWKSLESALAQDAPRACYEIIAIVGGRSEQEAMNDPNARGLLERCDAVVRFHEDLDIVENRMGPCEAGVAASSGEVLYFAEGHTILHPQCCRLIAAHFAANPSSQIVRGEYYDIPRNELSRLINLFKASRKRKGLESLPMISLGGQTAMKRELFGVFHHVSSRSGMFAEVDISIFVERNKIEVGKIGRPLCDHISDRTLEWLIGWVLKTGRTHFESFQRLIGLCDCSEPVEARDIFACKPGLVRGHAVSAFIRAGSVAASRGPAAAPVERAVGTSFLPTGLSIDRGRRLLQGAHLEPPHAERQPRKSARDILKPRSQ